MVSNLKEKKIETVEHDFKEQNVFGEKSSSVLPAQPSMTYWQHFLCQ